MPTFDLYLPRAYSPWRAKRQHFHLIAAVWVLFATWIARARERNALAGLNDHQLRDIGITRVEAMREAEKPFWK